MFEKRNILRFVADETFQKKISDGEDSVIHCQMQNKEKKTEEKVK